jgi:hypothetical protein
MIIKEEIAKIEGLAEVLKNEIEIWFDKYFNKVGIELTAAQAQAKNELHDIFGTDAGN